MLHEYSEISFEALSLPAPLGLPHSLKRQPRPGHIVASHVGSDRYDLDEVEQRFQITTAVFFFINVSPFYDF